MRHVQAWGAVITLLVFHATGSAQTGRDIRFVSVEQAEVRSGPSDSAAFYVTNRVARGQSVEVVAELPDGWLAIRPPEGSFSYINTRFLRHIATDVPTHVVTLDGVKVPVFMGSEVVNKRPTVAGTHLEPGSQVVSKGKPIADDDGSWMPIEAPARERRFLRASAVAKGPAEVVRATAAGATSPMHSTFTPSSIAPSAAPSANVPDSPDQTYRRARQAESGGDLGEAVRLYALVGADAARSNPALSSMALERARFLQSGYQTYGGSAGVASPPIQVGAPTAPGGRVSGSVPAYPQESSSFNGQTPRLPQTRNGGQTWASFRGVLRNAGRTTEGQKTYVLDDLRTGFPILYTTASRGLSLEQHLNRPVTISGYSVYRGDLRNNYMIAVRLVPE